MIISENKVVSVSYELTTSSSKGEIIETVAATSPLTFISGTGNLLAAFEENLSGLKEGDSFSFSIPCKDAYGEPNEKAVVSLPIDAFIVDGQVDNELLQIGNVIPMRDQSGRRLNGKVKEVAGNNVTMDFNHPLAGDDLHFKGTVVGVREATAEEVAHGHIHEEHSCGCDGDSCGSDSCGTGCGDEGCEGGCCH